MNNLHGDERDGYQQMYPNESQNGYSNLNLMLPPLKTAVNVKINEDSDFGSKANLHEKYLPMSTRGKVGEQPILSKNNSNALLHVTASK